ncbi:hypothetical protein NL676_002245 [Syzygium grande]|nr:hypothetical protein NL676_002245 [Syzygium grande]
MQPNMFGPTLVVLSQVAPKLWFYPHRIFRVPILLMNRCTSKRLTKLIFFKNLALHPLEPNSLDWGLNLGRVECYGLIAQICPVRPRLDVDKKFSRRPGRQKQSEQPCAWVRRTISLAWRSDISETLFTSSSRPHGRWNNIPNSSLCSRANSFGEAEFKNSSGLLVFVAVAWFQVRALLEKNKRRAGLLLK